MTRLYFNNVVFVFILVLTNIWPCASEVLLNKTVNEKESKLQTKNEDNIAQPAVNTKFFDLGGIFNFLFPNINKRPSVGNPAPNFPQNSQFNPGVGIQGNPSRPSQGSGWQVGGTIPNPDQENSRPNQGIVNPQESANGSNQWQSLQNPTVGIQAANYLSGNNNNPGSQFITNQNGNINQIPPNWNPQPVQNNLQPPNSNGFYTYVQPNPSGQNINPPQPILDLAQGRPTLFPNQNNHRPVVNDNYPPVNIPDNQYSGINLMSPNQRQDFNQPRPDQFPIDNKPLQQRPFQNPNQGTFQNPDNYNNGGTLDDIAPQYNNSDGNVNAILGKPVRVPTTTISPDQIVFENNNSTISRLQNQCVQDCPSTGEYNPICGTDSVTYFNPGKFVCARNCGIRVYVVRRGVCRRRPM